MIDLTLTGACAGLYARAWYTAALRDYEHAHGLDLGVILDKCGAVAVIPIVDCGRGRFDFGRPERDPLAFVMECLGEDGERTDDLIAWPVLDPTNVMTMLGRAGIVGMWEAMNPATYYLNKPLVFHRTVLDWLKAGCRGAAIADKRVAARQFLDLPGLIAGQNHQHGRELVAIAESVIDRSRILAPTPLKEVA